MNLKQATLALSLTCLLCGGAAIADEQAIPSHYVRGHAVYGEQMPSNTAPLPLAQMLARMDDGSDAPVLVSGRIGQVCQKKGCWMMLTDDGIGARVRFGDHAFTIPKASTGRAIVLGKLRAVELSERDAKHMAKDAGKDPDSVSGPQQEWELMATSVLIMADS